MLAKRHGFIVKNLSFSNSKKDRSVIPISGKILGLDDNISAFLNGLENMERLTKVNSMSVTDSSKYFVDLKSFAISMEIYVYDGSE